MQSTTHPQVPFATMQTVDIINSTSSVNHDSRRPWTYTLAVPKHRCKIRVSLARIVAELRARGHWQYGCFVEKHAPRNV